MTLPKYAKLEVERRFLVDALNLPPLDQAKAKKIDDLYLEGGRLRLRAITSRNNEKEYKLCKKYGSVNTYQEPIVNIYLTESEYALFASLPGNKINKVRFYIYDQGTLLCVDLFDGALQGLVLAEFEAGDISQVTTIAAPLWAKRDVTSDPFFTGGNLSRVSAGELDLRLKKEGLGVLE